MLRTKWIFFTSKIYMQSFKLPSVVIDSIILKNTINKRPFIKGGPTVLVCYVALIGNHGIVQITYCRWCCGSLVTQGFLCTWNVVVGKNCLQHDGDSNVRDVFGRFKGWTLPHVPCHRDSDKHQVSVVCKQRQTSPVIVIIYGLLLSMTYQF